MMMMKIPISPVVSRRRRPSVTLQSIQEIQPSNAEGDNWPAVVLFSGPSTSSEQCEHDCWEAARALTALSSLPCTYDGRVVAPCCGNVIESSDDSRSSNLYDHTAENKVKTSNVARASWHRLCKFKNTHGHCRVPRSDRKLHTWTATQRIQYSALQVRHPEKVVQLNSIGFNWRITHDDQWMAKYKALLQYKQTHGDCLVPRKYSDDRSLGQWVNKQRCFYTYRMTGRENAMNDTRVKLLEETLALCGNAKSPRAANFN